MKRGTCIHRRTAFQFVWLSGATMGKIKIYSIVRQYAIDCVEQNVTWASSLVSYFE
jgi:hypothetical protein